MKMFCNTKQETKIVFIFTLLFWFGVAHIYKTQKESIAADNLRQGQIEAAERQRDELKDMVKEGAGLNVRIVRVEEKEIR